MKDDMTMLGTIRLVIATGFVALAFPIAGPAMAHCDGVDGPVVTAARQALEAKDLDAVLIWVQPSDEDTVREAFRQAIAVRGLGPDALDLADRYFFETLVRLHRAGEGAPYNGLQPAGRDLGPAIPLADRAVKSGSDREVAAFVAGEAAHGLHDRFEDLQRKRRFDPADLAAGREYIESYVAFVHYVEGLHRAATGPSGGHYQDDHQGANAATQ